MRFGSQEIYDFIVYNLKHSKDFKWYNDLYEVIKEDTKQILPRYCKSIDKYLLDEITQEAALQVFKSLVRFVEQSADKTERQRNSWLKKVIYSKYCGFIRKNGLRIYEDNRKGNTQDQKYYEISSLDEENDIKLCAEASADNDPCEEDNSTENTQDQKYYKISSLVDENNIKRYVEVSADNNPCASIVDDEYKRNAVTNSLRYLFSLNTTPDKIMAFVFSKLIYTYGTGKVNGQAKKVAKDFAETSLPEMFLKMYAELKDILLFDIPDDVFYPLIKKINKTDSFALTARKITLGSNWISEEMKNNKENIFNSEEE